MNKKQIEMLRRLIQDEIEVAGVDGFEHGVWGYMDRQLDKNWKEFQETFTDSEEETNGRVYIESTTGTAGSKAP